MVYMRGSTCVVDARLAVESAHTRSGSRRRSMGKGALYKRALLYMFGVFLICKGNS